MRFAWALLAGLAALAQPQAARADVFALVVGIDHYSGIVPLRGAVNDAADIAQVLRGTGARRVELLTDEAAQLDRLLEVWNSFLAEAKRGDTIIFSFAGHGAQEPDVHLPKDELDGYDEVFLLQGFSESDDKAFADKLYDDDLYDWAMDAEARGINVIYVFDACHAGIPVRSIDPRVEGEDGSYTGFRFTRYSTRPTAPSAVDDPSQLAHLDFGDNIIALGATDESLRVREQQVDGKPRGILSWAFARALEGAADADSDNVIASDELALYVKRTVFDRARHRQIPQVFAPTRAVRLISVLPDSKTGGSAAPPADTAPSADTTPPADTTSSGSGSTADGGPAPATGPSASDAPAISVFAPGNALADVTLDGVELAAAQPDAEYLWDPATGDLIDVQGDVLAFGLGQRDVRLALNTQRLREAISTLIAEGNALDVELQPSDKVHCAGESLVIQGISSRYNHYTAFNVTGAGQIQFLWPLERFDDPVASPAGEPWRFETEVGEPYGSDAVVLIATEKPLEKLHAVLEYTADILDPLELWRLLDSALKDTGYEIAVQDIFTRDKVTGSQQCG